MMVGQTATTQDIFSYTSTGTDDICTGDTVTCTDGSVYENRYYVVERVGQFDIFSLPYNADLKLEEDEIIKLSAENAHKSRWIMREGKRLNMKTPDFPFVPKMFFRKLIPCNRKGMGLRIRRREK